MPERELPSISLAELPTELRRLTDPATPLPPGWLLIGHGLPRISLPLLRTAAAGLTALLFAFAIPVTTGPLAWVYVAVTLGALLYGVFPARTTWAATRHRLDFHHGSWRQGLHLGPSQLLLWDGQRAVLVDRSDVEQLKRLETREPAALRNGRPISKRRCVLSVRQPAGRSADLALPMVEPGDPDGSSTAASTAALERWMAGEPQPSEQSNPNQLRDWARNLLLGHAVLLGVSVIGMLGTVLIAYGLGLTLGALVGLLLGFPLFMSFPLLLRASVGRYLARGDKQRPLGWGYFMLLGLAGMILIILGSHLAGQLFWQLRASESPARSVSEIAANDSGLLVYPWTKQIVPSASITGYHVHRRYLGDAQWIESSNYVALLDDGRGCVWLGLKTDEGRQSQRSLKRLLEHRSAWLAPAVGLESAGYADAIENARGRAAGAIPSCSQPVVLEASLSLGERRAATLGQLGLIMALGHGLPLLALLALALWRLDSRPQLRYAQP